MENKLTRLCKEQRVNISEMSRNTGIAYGTLYDIVKGTTPLESTKVDHLIKIAHELGTTADEIIGENGIDYAKCELCQIYDNLSFIGRQTLIACARGMLSVLAISEDDEK